LAVVGVLVAAAAFGVVEQWAGAGRSSFVTALGGMAAPWLIPPFLVGASRASRRGAAVLGFAVALVAVTGFVSANAGPSQAFASGPSAVFWAMFDQPLPWLFGAVVSGPVYGLLGYQWRVTRSWWRALAVTVPVMLEPVVRWRLNSSGMLIWAPYAPVAWAEALAGLALTAAAITHGLQGGIPQRSHAKPPGGPVRRLARMMRRAGGIAVAAVGVVAYLLPTVSQQLYADPGSAVALTADGRTLYTVNQVSSGFRSVWEPDLPTIVTRIDTASMRVETSVVAAPLGTGNGPTQAIVTRDDQTVYVVDSMDGAGLMAIHLRTGSVTTISIPGGANRMALSPDGTTLYVSTNRDTIVPVAAATARPGHPIQLPRGRGKDVPTANLLALTADGTILYVDLQWTSSASLPDELVGINLATGKSVPFDYHPYNGVGMVLAPDGRTLYVTEDSSSADGDLEPRLIAVSTVTGKQVGRSLALTDVPLDLAVTPDGQALYLAGTNTIFRVPLSLATGGPAARPATVIGWLGNQLENALAISPDGRYVYVDGFAGIQLIRRN
jgi:DNA-binding beta-propeller fold protein YncE